VRRLFAKAALLGVCALVAILVAHLVSPAPETRVAIDLVGILLSGTALVLALRGLGRTRARKRVSS
jgi:hypothetical protein